MFILLIPTLAQTAVHVLTLALTELSNQRKQSNIDIIKDSRPEQNSRSVFLYPTHNHLQQLSSSLLLFFSSSLLLFFSSLLSSTFFYFLLSLYFLILSSFHLIQPSIEASLYKPHHKQHFHLNKNRQSRPHNSVVTLLPTNNQTINTVIPDHITLVFSNHITIVIHEHITIVIPNT